MANIVMVIWVKGQTAPSGEVAIDEFKKQTESDCFYAEQVDFAGQTWYKPTGEHGKLWNVLRAKHSSSNDKIPPRMITEIKDIFEAADYFLAKPLFEPPVRQPTAKPLPSYAEVCVVVKYPSGSTSAPHYFVTNNAAATWCRSVAKGWQWECIPGFSPDDPHFKSGQTKDGHYATFTWK